MTSTLRKSSPNPQTQDNPVYLKDYRVSDYLIDTTRLHFDLKDDSTVVTSSLQIRKNPEGNAACQTLVLQGVGLELRNLSINGKDLDKPSYAVDKENLTIHNVPANFTLSCVTSISPEENTSLLGLSQSQGLYCTQCEPQGFRKITYYLDRPDVLSEFTTTVVADKERFPVLLSNGNLVDQGTIDNRLDTNHQSLRHWATWHDPFKKPSYLFALVAGDLDVIKDSFTTCSGRKVVLRLFADNKDLDKCHHAMQSLKQAMRWDEQVYGREYDLDIFMIVVVAELNIGGMENKGLNICRADHLLVDPETTTDADIQSIESTVAHEYFHNWSGNRVTCRDWFQLTLKEGFTVYREFQFCADKGSAAIKRIEESKFIRTMQFAEDASPLAHPIRPESYRAIWNFYTPTVYQKGAEVIRMLATLLGPECFRQGSDLYFQRHDGLAATTEDFIAAMEFTSGRDLSQFKRWYSQAGTPRAMINGQYDTELKQFAITVKQTCPTTPENPVKKSFHLPLVMSLIGQKNALPLYLKPATDDKNHPKQLQGHHTMTLEVTEPEQTFIFEQINEKPVPSLFQDFSAPVKWSYDYSNQDLALILRVDTNDFCRWEASQILWTNIIHQAMRDLRLGNAPEVPAEIMTLYHELLEQVENKPNTTQALVTQLLTLPSEEYLSELAESIDIVAIHQARRSVKKQLAMVLKEPFQLLYDCYRPEEPISITPAAMAGRALRNLALDYLVDTAEPVSIENCYQQYLSANNMTDTMAALACLVNSEAACAIAFKQNALATFYDKWQHQPLVVNQWLEVQARCPLSGTLATVKELLGHPAFDIKSPNQVTSLIGGFCYQNTINFHHEDGSGYRFLIDQVIRLNEINPQMASRTLARSSLINWKRYDGKRQTSIKSQLQRLQALPALSGEVLDVVGKCLQN